MAKKEEGAQVRTGLDSEYNQNKWGFLNQGASYAERVEGY